MSFLFNNITCSNLNWQISQHFNKKKDSSVFLWKEEEFDVDKNSSNEDDIAGSPTFDGRSAGGETFAFLIKKQNNHDHRSRFDAQRQKNSAW